LAAACVTDAIGLAVRDGKLVAQRYALGGNTVATEVLKSRLQVVAVRPKIFPVAAAHRGNGEIVPVEPALAPPRVTVVQRRPKTSEGVDLEKADVVVAAGRGLRKREDLAIAQSLADALRGELGCSRSLCSDYGWLSEERMIGISGKNCSPQLHVSVGISGQIQHTVGILGSKVIVAINKDRSAPIFSIADYGIVGDLYDILPRLVERLKERIAGENVAPPALQ
jgi:electron transfer flavoprotein alpha subunit